METLNFLAASGKNDPKLNEFLSNLTALAAELLAARSFDFTLPAPHSKLRSCVVIPARNEEAALPRLIAALAAQRDLQGYPLDPQAYEVVLLANNCTDRTAEIARDCRRQFPGLQLHIAEVTFEPAQAHVGKARQVLFDCALNRFRSMGRRLGIILTTDADSRPAPDWIAQNELEIAEGAEGVGGRILLEPEEFALLPEGVRRLFLMDIGYRRALEELRFLYAPQDHDPFPRHHQNFGGSLAVTTEAYTRAGGMPLRVTNEDVGLYQAIVQNGGRFRHSYRVVVHTSARMAGRAQGGLADALAWWDRQNSGAAPVMVECAEAAERRLARLGLWCAEHPLAPPPAYLTSTPEPPSAGTEAEIYPTLCALREHIEELRSLTLAQRLEHARRRFEEPGISELAA